MTRIAQTAAQGPLRVVIDSNMLQSDELRVFLSVSRDNQAVISEFAWIEAYKGDALSSITKRMSVLARFPAQAIVLKGNATIAALDPRAPGLAARMARPKGREEFAQTIEAIQQASSGDPEALKQVLEHGQRAHDHIEGATMDVPHILGAMPEIQEQLFTAAEIQSCRTGKPYTRQMRAKILGAANQISETLYGVHPKRPRKPSQRSRPDAFLYRYSLGIVLYLLRWIETGSQIPRNHPKVRNDFVDLTFATLGTYFNGLMTDDKRARSLHLELRNVLSMLGARIPCDYVGEFRQQLADQGWGRQQVRTCPPAPLARYAQRRDRKEEE